MARGPSKPLVFEDEFSPPPAEEQYQTLHEVYQILAEELVTTGSDRPKRHCWSGWRPEQEEAEATK